MFKYMNFPSNIVANVVVDNDLLVMERGWREMSPACPRCGSSNTKFCYYNNYSLTQPRYFCKGCRRYWTKGGSLRNVPVGGGCRKSRRSRSSALRLTTPPSSNSHNHRISHQDHEFGDHRSSYGNMSHNNNMADSSSSPMNSEAPRIDLAVVYANFLNQKPQNSEGLENDGYNNNSNNNNNVALPLPFVELSSIPDATAIVPTSQVMLQEHATFVHCSSNLNNNDHSLFSQGVLPMPELMHEIDHQNQVLFVNQEIGLPMLPADSLISHHHPPPPPWPPSELQGEPAALRQEIQDDLESDSQLANMFNNTAVWNTLDLPGFETSSSSSKP